MPIAHPKRFTPDWTFGIRDDELQKLVNTLRTSDKVDAVVLLSHNGMDVDLKLASRVSGIDVILGGHTHDAVPQPIPVTNAGVPVTMPVQRKPSACSISNSPARIATSLPLLPVFRNYESIRRWRHDRQMREPHAAAYATKLATSDRLLYRRGNFGAPWIS